MIRPTLLLADRDRELLRRLSRELAGDGYLVVHVRSADALGSALLATAPNLIVLGDLADWPANAGLIDRLRSGDLTGDADSTPLIVLTDEADLFARVRCFEAGADDVAPKTTSYIEFRVRIRALLRRSTYLPRPKLLRVGELTVNLSARTAAWATEPLALSRIELRLLARLAATPDRVVAKDDLLREVWGYRSMGKTRTADAHASRLRRKLATAGADGWLVAVRGVGYRLLPETDERQVKPRPQLLEAALRATGSE